MEELILPETVVSELIDKASFELALNDYITFSRKESEIFHAKRGSE